MCDGPSEGQYHEWEGLLEEPVLTRDSVWITKERKKIPIREMDDHHLLNTIRVLRGKSPIGTKVKLDDVTRRDWLNAMANEAYLRGLTIEEPDQSDPIHE